MARPILQAKKFVGIPGTTSTTTIGLTSGWTMGAGGASYAPAQNDLVIVTYCVSSTSDVAIGVDPAAGYTEEQETYSNDTNDANLSVSWKKMGSTPDTSVDVSSTGNAQFGGCVIVEIWSGVDTTTPMDVASVADTGLNTGRPDPPAITPVTTDAVIVVCGGAAIGSGAGAFTSPDLDNFLSDFQTDTRSPMVGTGSFNWTSGSFDPAQWGGGINISSACWGAVTLALRPGNTGAALALTAVHGTFGLSGTATPLKSSRKLSAAAASFALSGTAASLRRGYRLSAAGGAFGLTGTPPALKSARALPASSAAFALSGTAATLLKGRRLSASAGAFALSGAAANLPIGRRLSAAAAGFAISGPTVSLKRGWTLVASGATFALSGAAASFPRGRGISAAPGAFALSGGSVSLLEHRLMPAAPASFGLAGQAAGLRVSGRLTALVVAFSLTGKDADLPATSAAHYALNAAAAAVAVAGKAAGLATGYRLSAQALTLSIGGTALQVAVGRRLAGEAGTFAVAGNDAGLSVWTGISFVPPAARIGKVWAEPRAGESPASTRSGMAAGGSRAGKVGAASRVGKVAGRSA